jgi:hypothetical protein
MGNICNNFSNHNPIEIQNKKIYISTPPYISFSKYHIDLSNISNSTPIPIINDMSSDNEDNSIYISSNYSSPNSYKSSPPNIIISFLDELHFHCD